MSWNSGSLWLPPLLGPFSSIRGLRLALEGCYFRKSRRSGSQSQDHHPALWGPGGRDPAAGQATLHSNTLGGPRAKPAPTVGARGMGRQQQTGFLPSPQPGREKPCQEVSREERGRKCQSILQSPTLLRLPASEGGGRGGESIPDPPLGAEGRVRRGSAFGNDSPFPVFQVL